MRGFWNDPDGITIEDLAVLCCLGLFVFTGVKLVLKPDVSGNQVDLFATLSYPIIAAIAKRAIERIGWPTLGRRGQVSPYQPPYPYDGYCSPSPQQVYTPRDEGSGDKQAGASNKPTI